MSCLFLPCLLSIGPVQAHAQPVMIGHDQAHLEDLKNIPPEWIDSAKAKLRVAYFHTSHGSQINSGLEPLDAFMGGKDIYLTGEGGGPGTMYLDDHYGPDLSNREGTFDDETRAFLDDPANGEVNVIMWSWCQILGHDGDEDPGYCSNMDSLIAEYGAGGSKIKSGVRTVPVQFVYMTGHLNGQGEEGRTDEINQYIRNHCMANSRILYDFADIESYDPDDNYFLDDYANDECTYLVNGERTGNWAAEWAAGKVMMDGEDDTIHNEPNGGQWYYCSPAHTHAVNGNMKAYAAWYLFARLAGWEGPDTAGITWITSIEIQGEGGSTEISTLQGTLQMTARVTPEDASDTTVLWSVINGTGQATITQDGLLQAVADGTVTVVAAANDGSGIEATLQVTISNQSTGIPFYQKPDQAGRMKIFPNPASDYIQVGGELEFPSTMRIYNMTGQLVREEKLESGEQHVDVSGLKQGLFIIRLAGSNTERTAGFMKK
jgi:hypothetical protein